MRRKTKEFYYGTVGIGSDFPITVQSMTNTDTRDIKSTVNQIIKLEKVDCDIIRVAVPDIEAAEAIKEIKKQVNIPIIADIHFNYKLALESIKSGVEGLRINPGNIGDEGKVKEVVKACKDKNIPIRIGVNSGSIKKEYLERYDGVNVNSMVESAMEHVRILENMNFDKIVISVKSTNIDMTIKSYEKLANIVDYPLHIGITESGSPWKGTIKSSIGIGSLLYKGIGDTIRVSLTGNPIEEVKVGKQILRSLGLLNDRIEIISCPTCGRTRIDLEKIVQEVENKVEKLKKPIKVAIMGCEVNGPGEAKEADIGIAGGNGLGLIFKKGKIIKKVTKDKLIEELIKEINQL
ncbi:flavodoxin-dependent (E)-4-hydroxy-3-methylbut-2-enyl-diphosphate synthase [Clostridium sp. D2Q-14]|uniref:flavodoxin-dependent (E)-4-hydroxy-3-methylbut-2-enyl-diphosphate synthase n=1 Tax=Anaeromonas gelatinilytica TaxID=2683194 RepID=UPI00193BD1C9|nr:flavodoxin-dependent (E)-4-hydroxy-3-methylbut-2-enyl-diphosphate synthase [Anaeromonas gelatinilytica]MBS4536014.1 flavodoxin-dependent (E)-4-hydroxy-3-methylbut-2-enyl-diphosphate synthase [Anaeromonas gelatinilytica]